MVEGSWPRDEMVSRGSQMMVDEALMCYAMRVVHSLRQRRLENHLAGDVHAHVTCSRHHGDIKTCP